LRYNSLKMTQIDFRTYLKQTSSEIEKELLTYLKTWDDYIQKDFADLKKANNKFTQSLLGGKMFRGTLVKLGYELFQSKETHAILMPAIAFEVLHTAFLIHDDIIDQSPMRRGKAALYVSKNKHNGISQAICFGDLGITLSIKLLWESDFPISVKKQAFTYFLHVSSTTILGETLDVQSSQKYTRTESQILKIQLTKTANYTIVAPLTVGAMLAGADETSLQKIKLFGEYLGIAYQIGDDILGVFGEEHEIGKSTTSDITENKSTLLFTYALTHADTKQKDILKRYYGKKRITSKKHELVKKVFQETGSLAYSQEKIVELTRQAKTIIPEITNNKDGRQLLTQFADMLTRRNK
jgi:geranylgeranyl pyrophosphate synthase